jgi:hypothetical protein
VLQNPRVGHAHQRLDSWSWFCRVYLLLMERSRVRQIVLAIIASGQQTEFIKKKYDLDYRA